MHSHNVPALRLEGFGGEWELKAIGDLFAERHESFPEGELLSVTLRNGIKRFQEIGRRITSNEDKSKYKLVEVGDIAYNSMRMWQGASGVSPLKGIVSPAYTVLKPIGSQDTCFFAYYFKTHNMIHEFQLNSQGLTSDTWNLKYPALSDIEIYRPQDIEEQQAIGAIFTNLDAAINQHTKKHQALQQAKTALMQRMFPQAGQTVPELRLEGFDGEWKPVQVGAVSDILTGYPFPSDEFVSNGVALIRGMNVKRGYISTASELTVFWPNMDGLREYELQEDDIILQMDGALIGRSMGIVTADLLPALLVQRVARIRVKPGYDPYFLFQWFHRDFLQYIRKSKTETAIPHLSALDIRRFLLQAPPTLEEQQAIGAVFTRLDTLIATEVKYIESLKQAKAALLQRMFI